MGSANKHRRAGRASSAQLGQAQQRGLYAIGQAAAASGVSAKMIRHYESVGLLPSAGRTAGNYRVYGHDRSRRSETVRRLALEHVTTLERKAQELQSMANSLKHLAHACHGDSRPDCPIIDDLALPGAHGAGS
jgi:MerR family copper efflux transcriptional regulator